MKLVLPKLANILKKTQRGGKDQAVDMTKNDPELSIIAGNINGGKREETLFDLRRRLFREAQAGHISAMVLYGQMLMRGEGGARDEIEARKWFGEAAAHKDAEGMFLYGKALLYAKGGPRDAKKGLAWVDKAARMQCHEAELFLSDWNEKRGGSSCE